MLKQVQHDRKGMGRKVEMLKQACAQLDWVFSMAKNKLVRNSYILYLLGIHS